MSLITVSSPHSTQGKQTAWVMRQVLYACVPALLCLSYLYGLGSIINVLWCSLLAVFFEALCLRLRHKSLLFYIKDNSALVTGVLLGLALPAFAPWWLSAIGIFVAIVISKHLYGGLGQNPFNPAMIAYALLLISFPVEMTRWPTISLEPSQSFAHFLGLTTHIDRLSGATPLDNFKITHQLLSNSNQWLMINLSFAFGGIYLLVRKIITWHIPVAFLGTLSIISTLFYLLNSTAYAPPLFHLLTGASMMGAFFIATDPVTAPSSNKGRIFYGIGIGLLIYVIRTWGGYPDAVAFSVLLMNLCAPLIDTLYQPRTFGHDVKPVIWKSKP